MTRTRLALPTVLLLLGSLAACGGDGPTDASKEDFCDAQSGLFSEMDLDADKLPSDEEMAEAFQRWGEKLEKVGTPKNISDEARAGWEELVEDVKDIDAEDLSQENLEKQLEDLGDETDKKAKAYSDYVSKECGDQLDDLEMPDMPDMPSSS